MTLLKGPLTVVFARVGAPDSAADATERSPQCGSEPERWTRALDRGAIAVSQFGDHAVGIEVEVARQSLDDDRAPAA